MDILDKSYEPMDIDLSSNSNAMDISITKSPNKISLPLEDDKNCAEVITPLVPPVFKEEEQQFSNTKQPITIKKFHIIKQKAPNRHQTTKVRIIISSLLILLLSIITYQVLSIRCSDDMNPDELMKSISTKLYGQNKAIDSLTEALGEKVKSKIIFFYGGTGVGKTFTASLILDFVGHYSNVYHYMMPSFIDAFTTEFMIGLTVCKHSIIIVDDLTANMNIETYIKNIITKSQSLDKYITIILIYNCDNGANMENQCDEFFHMRTLHNFKIVDAYKKLIKFESLREDHLRKCIDSELGNRKLSKMEYEKILKYFNVSRDGCKGVYTKMKLLEFS